MVCSGLLVVGVFVTCLNWVAVEGFYINALFFHLKVSKTIEKGHLLAGLSSSCAVARSRGSTQRRSDNPMGCTSSPSVAAGNLMVARLTILLAIAVAKGCMWSLEQPVNSLLDGHVLFQQFLRLKQVTCYRVSTSLSWFGADTRKPIWVYSSVLSKRGNCLYR